MTVKSQIVQPSLLGDLSSLYLIKKSETSGILDLPKEAQVELYPAGYTFRSERDNISRQQTYQELYEIAINLEVEDDINPFGTINHTLELVHDPLNKFDVNALHIILKAKTGPLQYLDGRDLGFIPKKINPQVLSNKHMVSGGFIRKVRRGVHKKYFNAKVVVRYGKKTATQIRLERFSGILEDL